jgi:hypothetical protein
MVAAFADAVALVSTQLPAIGGIPKGSQLMPLTPAEKTARHRLRLAGELPALPA